MEDDAKRSIRCGNHWGRFSRYVLVAPVEDELGLNVQLLKPVMGWVAHGVGIIARTRCDSKSYYYILFLKNLSRNRSGLLDILINQKFLLI